MAKEHPVTLSEHRNNSKIDGPTEAKSQFASKRPDGSINTHPQERMHAANQNNDQTL